MLGAGGPEIAGPFGEADGFERPRVRIKAHSAVEINDVDFNARSAVMRGFPSMAATVNRS
jgi:hypothetical protein